MIDNPVPSGNGLAAMLLVRLAAVTGRDDDRAAAEATLRACAPWMRQAPTGTFQLLLTADSIGVTSTASFRGGYSFSFRRRVDAVLSPRAC